MTTHPGDPADPDAGESGDPDDGGDPEDGGSGEVRLYAEAGASWWPVVYGPVLAGLGALIELLTRPAGAVHGVQWLLLGLAFATAGIVAVQARRRQHCVVLTPAHLRQGREALAVRRIEAVDDVGVPVGARVLGGAWTVPRGREALPLRLRGGSVVLAWARDPVALATALRPLVRRRAAGREKLDR